MCKWMNTSRDEWKFIFKEKPHFMNTYTKSFIKNVVHRINNRLITLFLSICMLDLYFYTDHCLVYEVESQLLDKELKKW